ncbi:peptidyl-prolyl cis-trans isomerase [Nocardioides sp.]|uniref:peptidylprolyl isomerase n=1 Tax=Nocardioides sp. TaxID=35761 RepID=UPI00321B2CC3
MPDDDATDSEVEETQDVKDDTMIEEKVRDEAGPHPASPANETGPDVGPEDRGRRRPTPVVWVAAAVVLALLAGGAFGWSQRGLPDGAVLQVGDTVVTQDDMRERQATFRALYGIEAPSGGDELAAYRRDAAKSVVVSLVLESAARERGVTVADANIDQTVSAYVTRFFGAGDEGQGAFVDALGSAGASQEDVRLEVGRQLVVARLFQDVTDEVDEPTPEEVRAAFEERRCDLRIPEQRDLRNIVVATRSDAFKVRAGLNQGFAFKDVVARRSIDQASLEVGGRIGRLGRADLEEDYARVAFAAAEGEIYGPVESQYGWNIGQVTKIHPAHAATFEGTRETLAAKLLDERRTAAWRDWLREQLVAADAEYADGYRPEDPTSPPDIEEVLSEDEPTSDCGAP